MKTFLRGLVIQGEVIHALILRETRTRFGAYQLGYLWALLEPALVILTFWGLFKIAHRGSPPGMDVFSFIATGIVPYTLFQSAAMRVSDSIAGNKALLNYPQVLPIDLVIARLLLEAATYAAVFIILMGLHSLWTRDLEIANPVEVIAGFALASLLGTALGLIFCGLAQVVSAVERARYPLMRPLFWISGIFFTVQTLPEHTRKAMLINPMLHITEMIRGGWFESYSSQYADPGYVLQWILYMSLGGLILERWVRRRIEVS